MQTEVKNNYVALCGCLYPFGVSVDKHLDCRLIVIWAISCLRCDCNDESAILSLALSGGTFRSLTMVILQARNCGQTWVYYMRLSQPSQLIVEWTNVWNNWRFFVLPIETKKIFLENICADIDAVWHVVLTQDKKVFDESYAQCREVMGAGNYLCGEIDSCDSQALRTISLDHLSAKYFQKSSPLIITIALPKYFYFD